jgi:hypothetical protein
MRETDETKQQRLLRALEIGEADISAGRTTPYTQELLAQIEVDARRHAAEARKPNPEVTP